MTSSQYGPYTLGHTHATMAKNNALQPREGKQIAEISPQFRLQSATRLHEAGIGSNRSHADLRLLPIPAFCRRVADCHLN